MAIFMADTVTDTPRRQARGRSSAPAQPGGGRSGHPYATHMDLSGQHGQGKTQARLPGTRQGCWSDEYHIVRAAIALIGECAPHLPDLAGMARATGDTPARLERRFRRWCGLTPDEFAASFAPARIRARLGDTAPAAGARLIPDVPSDVPSDLPSDLPSGRPRDAAITAPALRIVVAQTLPRARSTGLTIRFGIHDSPFGHAVAMMADGGLAGLSFADRGGVSARLEAMMQRWPGAHYIEDESAGADIMAQICDLAGGRMAMPVPLILIGSDFDINVWRLLLTVPPGRLSSYSALAIKLGKRGAARAVGGAVGRNPLSLVVPCHRIVGRTGAMTGFQLGLTRKRAMIGREAGHGTTGSA